MALQSFHLFSKFPPEIRIQIWKQAYLEPGPRIIEMKPCFSDHGPRRCYVAHNGIKNCCFHLPNDLKALGCNSCRCSPSVIESVSPGQMAGHTAAENEWWHLHRSRTTLLSPLLSTNREARYEAQRFGQLTYYSPACKPLPNQKPRRELIVPTYFNHHNDTLLINFDAVERIYNNSEPDFKGQSIQGLDKVTSLILQSPGYPTITDTCDLVHVLKLFPELQILQIALCQSGTLDESLASHSLIHSIRASDEEFFWEFFVEQEDYILLKEQINWLRKKCGGKEIPYIDLIMVQQDPEESEDSNAYGYGSYFVDSLYGGCWLSATTNKSRMRKFSRITDGGEEDLDVMWAKWERDNFLEDFSDNYL